MRNLFKSALAAAAMLASALPAHADEQCGPLKSLASVDTVAGPNGSMLVPVRINDSLRFLLLSTGGVTTSLSEPVVEELKLPVYQSRFTMNNRSGKLSDRYTIVGQLTIGQFGVKSQQLMVLPGRRPIFGDNRVAGIFAPNRVLDTDIDFPGHHLRLVSPDHCPGHVLYWDAAIAAAVPMRLSPTGHILIPATLDGKSMEAAVDTGTTRSTLSMRIARASFGLDSDSPGVTVAGEMADLPGIKVLQHRFGRLSFEGVAVDNPLINLVPDRNFQMPDTITAETPARLAGTAVPEDLVIGMDVLSKMHVYIAYNERKLYLTQ